MIKSELVEALCARHENLTHKNAEMVVTAVFDEIIEALANNQRVEIRGFGTFSARERAARTARNPKTGATVFVEAKRVPHFKTGKELRQRLNQQH